MGCVCVLDKQAPAGPLNPFSATSPPRSAGLQPLDLQEIPLRAFLKKLVVTLVAGTASNQIVIERGGATAI